MVRICFHVANYGLKFVYLIRGSVTQSTVVCSLCMWLMNVNTVFSSALKSLYTAFLLETEAANYEKMDVSL